MARRGEVLSFSRDRRRPPRWSMGLPPRRPPGRLTRLLRRIFDPVFYLKAVIGLGLLGLVLLPYGTDLMTAASKPVAEAEGECRVFAVLDGDTVTMFCPGRGLFRVRLLGLDAPEKFSPRCLAEIIAAEKATWALRVVLLQAKALDVTFEGEDRYGRRLARLAVDGVDVARLMIRAGHARTYGGGLRGGWC